MKDNHEEVERRTRRTLTALTSVLLGILALAAKLPIFDREDSVSSERSYVRPSFTSPTLGTDYTINASLLYGIQQDVEEHVGYRPLLDGSVPFLRMEDVTVQNDTIFVEIENYGDTLAEKLPDMMLMEESYHAEGWAEISPCRYYDDAAEQLDTHMEYQEVIPPMTTIVAAYPIPSELMVELREKQTRKRTIYITFSNRVAERNVFALPLIE